MLLGFLKPFARTLLAAASLAPSVVLGRTLPNTVRDVTTEPQVLAVNSPTSDQWDATTQVGVTLAMRNVSELQGRLNAGQSLANGLISQADYQTRYLPSQADYNQLKQSLTHQGLTVVFDDPDHTTVVVQGSVRQMAKAFSVQFGRVVTSGGAFTSAVSVPSLPDGAPQSVIGITGLQPHHRAHHHVFQAQPSLISTGSGYYVGPADIKVAYNVTSGMTGAGQTIAVIMDATVSLSDLATFWSNAGISDSASNITTLLVNGGPQNPGSGDLSEADLDVSYSSAMAPGAAVRLYAISTLDYNQINQALLNILSDKASIPSLSVVSMSFGGDETQLSGGELSAYTTTFMRLVAAGVTAVASSGDDGSNPTTTTSDGYTTTGSTAVNYPASDPNVLGVGGTALVFNKSDAPSSEMVWSEIPATGPVAGSNYLASGGGYSVLFAQPSWQKDGGTVLAQYSSHRCVPDVSAVAVGYQGTEFGVEIVLNGSPTGVDGTSLSAPIWAGLVAAFNQARVGVGQATIGLITPTLYTYSTSIFTDITSGTNGAYSATADYDLCSGLGSPKATAMQAVLLGSGPSITGQPQSSSVTVGTAASFVVTASGVPTPTYQWQREPNGSSTWASLTDGGAHSGSTGPSLAVTGTTTAMSGDQFRCTVSNSFGSITSSAATLTVTAAGSSTTTTTSSSSGSTGGSSGGGGGGGAPSEVFLGALAGLAALRLGLARLRKTSLR